jgi:hypothetical protein
MAMQAREILHIGRSTYHQRLCQGHFDFIREYRGARSRSVLSKAAPGWFAGT